VKTGVALRAAQSGCSANVMRMRQACSAAGVDCQELGMNKPVSGTGDTGSGAGPGQPVLQVFRFRGRQQWPLARLAADSTIWDSPAPPHFQRIHPPHHHFRNGCRTCLRFPHSSFRRSCSDKNCVRLETYAVVRPVCADCPGICRHLIRYGSMPLCSRESSRPFRHRPLRLSWRQT